MPFGVRPRGERMTPAPIALFVYRRPKHTQRTVAALQANVLANESDLFVFADGAKSESDLDDVRAVRQYLLSISGFRSVTIIERERNLGLAASILSGVTAVVNSHGKIIVVEDDIQTSPFFLRFMNDALAFYRAQDKVISISGYLPPLGGTRPTTFFLRGADCWGWATWRRGWELFEPDGAKLLTELRHRGMEDDFDLNGAYPYTRTLNDQVRGRNDSWAIRWHASAFLRDRLTLYPGTSLVDNIGNDGSGTHSSQSTDICSVDRAWEPVSISGVPLVESAEARAQLAAYYSRHGWFRKLTQLKNRFFP